MRIDEMKLEKVLYIPLIMSIFTETNQISQLMKIRPYYKSELAEAYSPFLTPGAALNRLAHWIAHNAQLTEALAQTGYRRNQHILTSRQVALIFEYLGEP